MNLFENIKMALNSLVKNKLRSFLTLVGIAVGLFSIIVVMTALRAIQTSVEQTFSSIGTNNFEVSKWPAITGHGDWRKYRNREDLTLEQGERLREMVTLPLAVGISLDRDGRVVKFQNESTNPNVEILGINLDQMIVSDLIISKGRGFTQADMEYSKMFCILGHDVAERLFKSIYPIGQEVSVENMRLEVIGVFDKKGSVLGTGQDNFIAIPLPVYAKYYGGERENADFSIMAPDKSLMTETIDQVIGALRKIRKIDPGKENDFEIITNDQLIEEFNNITQYFKLGAAVVACIALLAAGVGIMNIMLVSVTERTKEIGIRKAIGARKIMIRTQFLIEAIVLSQIGGLIGIICGVIGGNIIAAYLGISVILPIDWIIVGICVTTFVGITFGVYPAVKASNLDPIDALRYE